MKQQKSPFLEVNDRRGTAAATLLIPKKHLALFDSRKGKLGKSTGEFLEYLLDHFQDGKKHNLANRSKLTTEYQSKKQNLQRRDFRVNPGTWHRFKCLSRFYGVSICRLFVMLLLSLKGVGTQAKNRFLAMVKLFEKVKFPYKRANRIYKAEKIQIDTS